MLRSCTLPQGPGAGFRPVRLLRMAHPCVAYRPLQGALPPENGGGQKGGLYEDGLSSVRLQV